MSDYLPFVIVGLTVGSVYGIAALGLVLTYKTSGVFNFGHGAIAAAAATVFYQLHIRNGMPWVPAAVISVLLFGVITGLILERLSAGLADAATAYRIVATVGLVLIVPASFTLIYGPLPVSFPQFLPGGTAFTVSSVEVGVDAVVTTCLGLISVLALYLFFRYSVLGVAMRAVVDRPELLDLVGESPTRVRRISWVIGSSFAAVSGLLLANTQQQLDTRLLSLLVVQAFGAAAFGAFRSLPLAYLGGLVLGVVQSLAGKVVADQPELRGLDLNMPFLFLFLGLLLIPRGKLVELGQAGVHTATRARTSPRIRNVGVTLGLATAVAVPFVVDSKITVWTTALAALPLFLSLGLLVRTSGQISLCQVGFAAIGATTFAHLQSNGLPWAAALLMAGVVVIPVGALISIPAIRLSGLYLALATLGFGILLAQFFYTKSYMFGTGANLTTSRPEGFTSDRSYYFVVLAVSLVAIGVVVTIERARLGRLLRGVADSPTALAGLGTNTNVTRVLVFCLSAFLAGVSGALTAGVFGAINSGSFPYFQSLVVLAVLMICGTRTVPAAVLGTLLLTLPPAYITGGDDVVSTSQLGFGLAAIAVAVLSTGRFRSWTARLAVASEERLSASPAADRMPEQAPNPTSNRRQLMAAAGPK